MALAELYAFIREYEKAKADFAKIPPSSSLGRRSRLGFAAALGAQWRLHEALDATQQVLTEVPGDGQAAAQLVRLLGRANQLDDAVAAARSYLEANARNEQGAISVRFAVAKVQLDAGHPAEAAHSYRWLLERPGGRITAAYYGLARASSLLGDHEKAQQALATALTLTSSEARNRLLLADHFYADNDDKPAIENIQAVLERDPLNLAALIRLADAQLRVARFDAKIGPLLETCEAILRLSPSNIRGHLAKARARSIVQDFKGAVVEYIQLITIDPRFLIPRREKARVLHSDHQFVASAAAYQEILMPSADEVLHKDLSTYVQREPRAQALLDTCLHPGLSGKIVRAEVTRVMEKADEEVRGALQRILLDYTALQAEQTGVALEKEGKSKKDVRNYQAVPVYDGLITVEPGNEEAVFDLGQVYGGLKQTLNALPQFGRVLEIEPQHREAQISQERAGLELQPQGRTFVGFFSQSGRNGLANIVRTRYGASLAYPFRDENELVQLSFSRALYAPPHFPSLEGNILSARAQGKCCDNRLFLYGQANLEQYESGIDDRVTFDVGANYDVSDLLRLRVNGFLENVLENGESIQQEIFRYGTLVGADIRATRYWNLTAEYRYAHYSDHNDLEEMFLSTDYSITLPPKQLKLVGTVLYQSFSEQTVFADPTQSSLVGTLHPYFAPASFTYYEGRLEWYHWLSRDYFTYSNQCWYSLQYGMGWDDSFQFYQDVRALAQADLKPWLTVGAYTQGLFSRVYDSVSAGAYLIIRFPCSLRF